MLERYTMRRHEWIQNSSYGIWNDKNKLKDWPLCSVLCPIKDWFFLTSKHKFIKSKNMTQTFNTSSNTHNNNTETLIDEFTN